MVLLYLFLLFVSGVPVFAIINKNSESVRSMNAFESLALTFNIGLFLFYLYYFALSLAGVSVNFYHFLPVAAVAFIGIVLIFVMRPKFGKYSADLMEILLLITFALSIISLIVFSAQNRPIFPDEFSAWAVIPKINFFEGSLLYKQDYGFVKYPPFMTTVYSGFYHFIGRVDDMSVRIIQPSISFVNLLGIYGYAKRKGYNGKFLLIMLSVFMVAYNDIADFTASTYIDLVFACFYTLGCLYFIDILFSKNKLPYFLLSLFFMSIVSLIRPDGVYLLLFFIPIVLLDCLFREKRIKNAIWGASCIALSPIPFFCYEIFRKIMCVNAPPSDSSSPVVHELVVNMLTASFSQLFLNKSWMVIIIACCLLLFLCAFYRKMDKKSAWLTFYCIALIVMNIAFLDVCYIYKFGAEAGIAASFIRYMLRAVFVGMFACLVLEKTLSGRGELENN